MGRKVRDIYAYALSEHNWLSDQICIANVIELASVLCLGTTYSGVRSRDSS